MLIIAKNRMFLKNLAFIGICIFLGGCSRSYKITNKISGELKIPGKSIHSVYLNFGSCEDSRKLTLNESQKKFGHVIYNLGLLNCDLFQADLKSRIIEAGFGLVNTVDKADLVLNLAVRFVYKKKGTEGWALMVLPVYMQDIQMHEGVIAEADYQYRQEHFKRVYEIYDNVGEVNVAIIADMQGELSSQARDLRSLEIIKAHKSGKYKNKR